VPGGSQSPAIAKALADRGIDPRKTKVMAQMELTEEQALKNMGDTALGIVTSAHYDYNLGSRLNKEFVAAFNAAFKRNPDFFAVGGYDGMHLIYETLKRTAASTDGDALIAAAKGMAWESPRGPMSIDAATATWSRPSTCDGWKRSAASSSTSSSTRSKTSRIR